MGQSSTEKLREFLGQLPPKSQALLIREFERAIERGDDPVVPNFVLGELRKIVRQDSENATPRSKDPARLLFAMLDPFLVDNGPKPRPGQIRRASLAPVWLWLSREGLPDQIKALEEAVAGDAPDLDRTIRKIQMAAAEAINAAATPGPDRQRALARIGAPEMAEDIAAIGAVLQIREALETLGTRLPGHLRVFAESQTASVSAALNIPSLQTPQALPFALSVVMSRLAAPWQIIRLGIMVAGSDDEVRVAGTPYGVAVTMAIQDLARIVSDLRNDIRRGQFKDTSHHLKTLHDGMRGLRTELDIRSDSTWGRQLSAIRVEISNALQSEIDGVPGRVRRLLRQRPDKDIASASRIDSTEVEETAALIDFVAVCRSYASELAINEVTLRAYSDLQQYVEKTTEALVESLRGSDAKAKAFRAMQVDAAIRFCDVLFGPDYASLMRKASEIARTGERKSSRAS
jgi:hypothetical protein